MDSSGRASEAAGAPASLTSASLCCTLLLQFISILVALVLRLCIYPRDRDFESFEEGGENNQQPDKGQVQVRRLERGAEGVVGGVWLA